jgi:hypothetical protein
MMTRKDIIDELEILASELSEDDFSEIVEEGAKMIKYLDERDERDLNKVASF